jgi:hypothetical protein
VKPFVLRGALAGIAGGAASSVALLALGQPDIRDAIALEDAASGGHAPEALVGRGVQVVGGVAGMMVMGLALGVIFGVVYAACRHRLGPGGPWPRTRRLAVVAFASVHLVPFLKYPANPPAVGDPDTVSQRSLAYLSLLAVSILAVLLAGAIADRLRRRGTSDVIVQAGAGFAWLSVIVVAFVVLPAGPEPGTVPADLLWSFRVASLTGHAALWSATAVTFGLLAERANRRRRDPMSAPPESISGSPPAPT